MHQSPPKLSPPPVVQDQSRVKQPTTAQPQMPTSLQTIGSHPQFTKRLSYRGVNSNLITPSGIVAQIENKIKKTSGFIDQANLSPKMV